MKFTLVYPSGLKHTIARNKLPSFVLGHDGTRFTSSFAHFTFFPSIFDDDESLDGFLKINVRPVSVKVVNFIRLILDERWKSPEST